MSMSKQLNQKQIKKKKDRERRGKERALKQKLINQKKKQNERATQRAVRNTQQKGETFVSEKKMALKKLKQLEYNQQLLAALEAEHKKEIADREQLNAEFLEDGLETMEDKLNFVKENAEMYMDQLKNKIVTAEEHVKNEENEPVETELEN